MSLTQNQQFIVNVAIKAAAAFLDSESHQHLVSEKDVDLINDAFKVGANALMDLNRIADALEEANEREDIRSAVGNLSGALVQGQEGVGSHSPFSFRYTNYKNETEDRTVTGWIITYDPAPGYGYMPGWFIYGFDESRQAFRSFRIDERMKPLP